MTRRLRSVRLRGAQQQPAHSRTMHLDTQIVDVGIVLRQAADHFPDPEADLEAARRTAPENRLQVQWVIAQVQAVGRPKLRERALLRGRHAAGA